MICIMQCGCEIEKCILSIDALLSFATNTTLFASTNAIAQRKLCSNHFIIHFIRLYAGTGAVANILKYNKSAKHTNCILDIAHELGWSMAQAAAENDMKRLFISFFSELNDTSLAIAFLILFPISKTLAFSTFPMNF